MVNLDHVEGRGMDLDRIDAKPCPLNVFEGKLARLSDRFVGPGLVDCA